MAIYRLLRTDVSFGPEEIQAMHSAYEDVCKQLGLREQKNDRVTEVVALKIIEIARTGERNTAVLRDGALKSLGVIRPDSQRGDIT